MHGNIGIGKLSQSWKEVASRPMRQSNNDIRGAGAIYQFVEAIKPAQNRYRMSSRMDGELAPAQTWI
jgi:hypothetical protein